MILLLFSIITAYLLISGIPNPLAFVTNNYIIDPSSNFNSSSSNKQLNLKAFRLITPTPPPPPPDNPPSNPCGLATYDPVQCPQACGGGIVMSAPSDASCCVIDGVPGAGGCCNNDELPGGFAGNPRWCDAKPVIYLYPQKPTEVDVTLDVPGSIVESIPHYPLNGWKNIIAHPDGTFSYNNKIYKELFYEASITPADPPKTGLIVKDTDIQNSLKQIAEKLGFNSYESEELVSYWVPKLQSLKASHILISFFDREQKEKIDRVIITPRPDVFIEHILYFKPLSHPYSIDPLIFPPIPQRKGFTAVEWGGIIDK